MSLAPWQDTCHPSSPRKSPADDSQTTDFNRTQLRTVRHLARLAESGRTASAVEVVLGSPSGRAQLGGGVVWCRHPLAPTRKCSLFCSADGRWLSPLAATSAVPSAETVPTAACTYGAEKRKGIPTLAPACRHLNTGGTRRLDATTPTPEEGNRRGTFPLSWMLPRLRCRL